MKLIAGLDPGTTVGWAVLNLDGKFVASGSQKELSLDALISKLLPLGKVILVGSDKAKLPSFVQQAATKLGAKAVSPSFDVRVDEKRDMTASFSFNSNHEMDALASAVVAFKKVQPLLNKIRGFLEKEKQLGFFDDVVEIVLKEEISMRAALSVLTPKEKNIPLEAPEELKRDEDLVRIFGTLSKARKDNSVLLAKNIELEKRARAAEQKLAAARERMSGLVKPKTPLDIARVKDGQIASLSQRLKNSLQAQNELSRFIEKLERVLLSQDKLPIVRFSHLGWDELLKRKEFVVDSVVFVDDANNISEKAVDWLRSKNVQILVCGKLPGVNARSRLPFACVPAEECELLNKVALVNRSWLEKVRSDRQVLSKVVEEYAKERLPDSR